MQEGMITTLIFFSIAHSLSLLRSPDFVYNVEFVNFVSNSLRKAGAIGLLPNSKNIMLHDFASAKLRYTNSPGRYWWPNFPIEEELDDPKCSLVFDADGTV